MAAGRHSPCPGTPIPDEEYPQSEASKGAKHVHGHQSHSAFLATMSQCLTQLSGAGVHSQATKGDLTTLASTYNSAIHHQPFRDTPLRKTPGRCAGITASDLGVQKWNKMQVKL